MAYMTSEQYNSNDELIGGAQLPLMTANISITAGTAMERGSVVTTAGTVVKTGDTAYGILVSDVSESDTTATVYTSGVFNREKLIVDSADTVEAHEAELRAVNIVLTSLK